MMIVIVNLMIMLTAVNVSRCHNFRLKPITRKMAIKSYRLEGSRISIT